MKKNRFSLLVLLVVFLITACGGNSSENKDKENSSLETEKVMTLDEKIEEIKIKFDKIEKNSDLKVKDLLYANPDPEKYYDMSSFDAYYNGNELVKLIEYMGEEGYLSATSYYYSENKLFFIFIEYSYMDEVYEQNRYYLDQDGTVLKALIKAKDEGDATDIAKIENKENPEFIADKNSFNDQVQQFCKSTETRFKMAK